MGTAASIWQASLSREKQDTTQSVFRIGLDSCLSTKRAAITNVNRIERRKWGVCVSISLTSTGDLHLRAEAIALFRTKDCVTAIDFHHEGYLWKQKARKALSALERMCGDRARSTGTCFCDRILLCAWNENVFALSFHSANWRDLSQTISFLVWSLKDSPQNLAGMFTACLLSDKWKRCSFFWLEPCSCISKREPFEKSPIPFILAQKKVVWKFIHFIILSQVMYLHVKNLCTLVKTVNFA